MKQEVSIQLFGHPIATMHQDGDRIYLEQVDEMFHKVSPLLLSTDLKEIETTHLKHLEGVAGFISDSLPGHFGTEILNEFFLQTSKKYPTVSDKLLFIGNKGLGAVTYEPSIQRDDTCEETMALRSLFEASKKLKKGGEYHALQDAFLVSAHSFAGGARSKAVGAINLKESIVYLGDRTKPLEEGFMHAIIKYDDTQNNNETSSTYSKVEYIYYLLAKQSNIEISDSYLVPSGAKHHFVTKRFDIEPDGTRYHVHSLAGLLHLDYTIPRTIGYEDLLRTAVKLGALESLKQLFAQMLFNYMFVNQDDHSRNFSFMCDASFKWRATPAYDLTFAKGVKQTVEHQLSLYGKPLSQIDLDDITKLAIEFSIDLAYVAETLEHMRTLQTEVLPRLMREYNVETYKQEQILSEIQNRNLQGAL